MKKDTKTSRDSIIQTKHLEDAMFNNRAASANDCTGYSNTIPENEKEAENLSSLMNVPTSPPRAVPKGKRQAK